MQPYSPSAADAGPSALSCPEGVSRAARVALYGTLVAELQQSYVHGLLLRGGSSLVLQAPTLHAVVRSALDDGKLWSAALPFQAALVAAANQGSGEHDWLLGQVGLALHAQGHVAQGWSLTLPEPRQFRCGDWITPAVCQLAVTDVLTLDGVACDVRDEQRMRSAGCTRLPGLTFGAQSLHIVAAPLAAQCPLPVAELAGEEHDAALLEVLREALVLLQRCAPAYLHWALDALRTLVPVTRPADAHRSGSFRNIPGCIVLGVPVDVVTLVELLVHEASHQYLGALRASHRLSTGRDERRYYSPFPKAEREIEGILVGYHAFANIARVQQLLVAHAAPHVAAQAQAWLHEWSPALRSCERSLSESPGLTSAGEQLWRPIAQTIARSAQPDREGPTFHV